MIDKAIFDTEVSRACINQDTEKLTELLLSIPDENINNKVNIGIPDDYTMHGPASQMIETSPLHIAVYFSLLELAESLLSKGANIDQTDMNGETPLMMVLNNAGIDIDNINAAQLSKLLITKGADVNLGNKTDLPLGMAIRKQLNNDVILLMIAKGADINRASTSGETAILEAIRACNKTVTEYLIKNRADINAISKFQDHNRINTTPLGFAVTLGYPGIVKLLIENGADVHAVNNEGKTPIAIAAEHGNLRMVQLLVRHGATIGDIKKEPWATILNNAKTFGQKDLVNYITKDYPAIKTILTMKAGQISKPSNKSSLKHFPADLLPPLQEMLSDKKPKPPT